MDEGRLHRFLADPFADLNEVMEAATRFAAFCERNFSMPVFAHRWGDLLRPMYVPETETGVVIGEGQLSAIPIETGAALSGIQQHRCRDHEPLIKHWNKR